LDNDREFSPSLKDVLRLASELPLRNEELLLSIEELLPGEVFGRTPEERLLLATRELEARDTPVALRPYWLR